MLPAHNAMHDSTHTSTDSLASDTAESDTAEEEARERQLYERLDAGVIAYRRLKHPRVFTVDESRALDRSVPGLAIRNLFVRDRKRRFFLLCLPAEQPLDLKVLSKDLSKGEHGDGQAERLEISGRLSFGNPQELKRLLGVTPGAVNPFAITFDTERVVSLVLDSSIAESACFNAHPMRNDRSIALSGADFLRFLALEGREARLFDFRQSSAASKP